MNFASRSSLEAQVEYVILSVPPLDVANKT